VASSTTPLMLLPCAIAVATVRKRIMRID